MTPTIAVVVLAVLPLLPFIVVVATLTGPKGPGDLDGALVLGGKRTEERWGHVEQTPRASRALVCDDRCLGLASGCDSDGLSAGGSALELSAVDGDGPSTV